LEITIRHPPAVATAPSTAGWVVAGAGGEVVAPGTVDPTGAVVEAPDGPAVVLEATDALDALDVVVAPVAVAVVEVVVVDADARSPPSPFEQAALNSAAVVRATIHRASRVMAGGYRPPGMGPGSC
jgi:hypothetical protein